MKTWMVLMALSLARLESDSADDADSVRRVIERHHADAACWYATGDVDSIASLFAEDAWLLPANSPPRVGREAIRAHWRQAIKWGKWDFTAQLQKLDVAGPIAVERGRYIIKFTAGSAAPAGMASFEDRGNFLVHWRREADGQWRIVADAPVSELPMQPPPTSGAR